MKYDPFAPGPFAMRTRNFEARDEQRKRVFPIDVWHPETDERFPLILFSHASLQNRRSATFLCTHLCSHGYVVAALDHSETVASELKRQPGESEEQKHARWQEIIDSRVPDIRFLLDTLRDEDFDRERIAIAGHSAGGWTALASPDTERRIRAIVALAPGGASNPRPGILPATLDFQWQRDIPTLLIAAENDVSLPLAGMYEVFGRIPSTNKKMMILRRADHLHFVDDVETWHEGFRTMPVPPEVVEIQKEMLPISELMSGEEAHRLIRGWTLAHFDTFLKANEEARRFLLHV